MLSRNFQLLLLLHVVRSCRYQSMQAILRRCLGRQPCVELESMRRVQQKCSHGAEPPALGRMLKFFAAISALASKLNHMHVSETAATVPWFIWCHN